MQKFLHDSTEFLPILLQGVWLTILVTLGSLILSTILGLLWALLRVSGVRAVRGERRPDQCDPWHPDHRAAVLSLLRDARFRRHADRIAGGDPRSRHRLFGLSGGKFSRRHRGHRQGTDRSRADHRHGLVA